MEERRVYYNQVPFRNGMYIDGPENGPSPNPNSIVANPESDRLFEIQCHSYEIPHTASVIRCRKSEHNSLCCNGTRKIKKYQRLAAIWTTKADSFIVDKSGLLMSKIAKAAGHTILQETQPNVSPIMDFPDTDVTDRMVKLIGQHNQIPGTKVYRQRHYVEISSSDFGYFFARRSSFTILHLRM